MFANCTGALTFEQQIAQSRAAPWARPPGKRQGAEAFRHWTMMPEGPECKRTADQLNDYCAGWSLSHIELLSGRYITHGPPAGFERFSAEFLPAKVERVSCKGKFIFMSCSSPAGQASIWSTLASIYQKSST